MIQITVEAEETKLIGLLISIGGLTPEAALDRREVEAALSRLVDRLPRLLEGAGPGLL